MPVTDRKNDMLFQIPVPLKLIAPLILFISGLTAHVTAQTIQEGKSDPNRIPWPTNPVTGKPVPPAEIEEAAKSSSMIIQRNDSGEVKFNAERCRQEDVYRVVAAMAKKNIRIESLPDTPLSIGRNSYMRVDALFQDVILESIFIDVTKEGDTYVIRENKQFREKMEGRLKTLQKAR